ncbi:MAG: putative porin [Sedimentisphaerales bacterium]|nr:putative porin [Sedimentisphaerales bacterium]
MEMRIMRKLTVLRAGLLLSMAFACGAGADEISDLKKQLAEMQTRIEQLEARQKKVIAEEADKAVEKKQVSALPDSMKWVEKVKIGGDIRYRHESIDEQSGGDWKQGVNRHRLRARLSITGKVNEDIDLGFRLASGSADPVSTNQNLESSFSSKDLWLDLAYFDWHPTTINGFKLIGGKMPQPFYRVGGNQLIWDDDLNPEGLAAKYETPINENLKAYLCGGGFWVEERDSAGSVDSSLWGIQAYLKNKFDGDTYLLGGLTYYDYGNIEDQRDLAAAWRGSARFFGNTPNPADTNVFAYDYDIIEGFVEYGFKLADFPVAVYGNYAHNTAAPGSKSNGWLIGLTFNKLKDPGSWRLGYNYRDLDSDAVVGQFNESDFIGGGTDGKGHRFNFAYQLAKNFEAGLTYFLNERKDDDKNDYRRFEADLVFKF